MFVIPNDTLAHQVGRDRQARFRASVAHPRPDGMRPVRVRLGRMLISIGSTISGDRVEAAPRQRAAGRAA